ncbi:MAG: double zinc ribbon domain-containing protein [Treponemataceae bacterium]|nr:double zinc ribbon domain-containing protein [Treponemataceae bacterium]
MMGLLYFSWLWGASCLLCGTPLVFKKELLSGLCNSCGSSFLPYRGQRCFSCGRPLISEKEQCIECREKTLRSYDKMYALYPYEGPYRKLLAAYKFEGHRCLAYFFAQQLIKSLFFFDCSPFYPSSRLYWVPVPPRPGKIKHAGWDQIAEIGACLPRIGKKEGLSLSVVSCLRRRSGTIQKRLNREERHHNMQGNFEVCGKVPEQLILFDDVITTGATLEACAATLRRAGARCILALALFYD